MKTYEYGESQALFGKAAKVIPCGIYGHYSPAPCIPVSDYPLFASRAGGCKFWDVDGNEFIDYMCAYGPMILGYNNPIVEEAYRNQLSLGDTTTCASPRMVEPASPRLLKTCSANGLITTSCSPTKPSTRNPTVF